MELRVGTAGYSYPAWVGPFYPPGTGGPGLLAAVADEGRADSGLVFFNNCVGTQAVENARRLVAILKETAPAVAVAAPPAPAERQPSLFEADDAP